MFHNHISCAPFVENISDTIIKCLATGAMVAFRMSAATWPGSAALRLVLSIVKRAVWYSLTFGENLTLLLGLLKAQPVCRDDLLEVTSENVGGPPEGT